MEDFARPHKASQGLARPRGALRGPVRHCEASQGLKRPRGTLRVINFNEFNEFNEFNKFNEFYYGGKPPEFIKFD